jgi:uncharacterized protein
MESLEAQREAAYADAAPMGLFAMAMTAIILALVIHRWQPGVSLLDTMPTILMYAAFLQFVGGLLARKRGDGFGSTAWLSFGVANLLIATFFWMRQLRFIHGSGTDVVIAGIVLFVLGYVALLVSIARFRARGEDSAVVVLLGPAYVCSALPLVGANPVLGQVGEGLLIAATVVAFGDVASIVARGSRRHEAAPRGVLLRH